MALDKNKQKVIEQYFDMSTGYVLHYVNRTFADLFMQFSIDIENSQYRDIGDSKAKRLRSFFNQHDDNLIGRVLLKMIEEYDAERDSRPYSYPNHNDALRQRCMDIANELAISTEQTQVANLDENSLNYQLPEPNKAWFLRAKEQFKSSFELSQENQMQTSQANPTRHYPTKDKIFIVHGHDEHLLIETENLCRKLNLEPIILKEQHSGGRTIIEKIEAHSDVRYAIILYTACDEGRKIGDIPLKQRARQNVVFEHGYFIGKLGRQNVAAVVKGNVEIQGDIDGVVYVSYIGGWQFNLAKEMKGAGLTVDLNTL